ncbi:MAG: tetratricopeptide repeat protein [Desulfobacteraceae bacterium]|nr:tetratricopeptide repeat protein [Desulfobacteraceae bacterium]
MNLAKTDINEAIKINPEYVKARLLLADIYMRERDMGNAEKESRKVLELEPDNYQGMLNMGSIYMAKQESDNAKKMFEACIKASPNDPSGHYRLGFLYRAQKDYDKAMTSFEKALSINPKLMDVFSNIVFLHGLKKEYEPALAKCDKQLQIVKDSPVAQAMVWTLRGKLYTALKKKTEAEDAYKKALELDPDQMQPYYDMATLYLMENNGDKAIEQYKAVLHKSPIRQVLTC